MRIVSIYIVLAIVVLAVLGFLFKDYFDRNAAAEAASVAITTTNSAISTLNKQNQTLTTQIEDNIKSQAKMQEAIIAAGDSIPDRMNSNDILREVLDLCSKYSVTGIPLSTNDWASVQIQKRPYYVFKMSLKLSGTQANLIDCVAALQNELYPTLAIQNLVISQPALVDELPVVDLSLAIYAK